MTTEGDYIEDRREWIIRHDDGVVTVTTTPMATTTSDDEILQPAVIDSDQDRVEAATASQGEHGRAPVDGTITLAPGEGD